MAGKAPTAAQRYRRAARDRQQQLARAARTDTVPTSIPAPEWHRLGAIDMATVMDEFAEWAKTHDADGNPLPDGATVDE